MNTVSLNQGSLNDGHRWTRPTAPEFTQRSAWRVELTYWSGAPYKVLNNLAGGEWTRTLGEASTLTLEFPRDEETHFYSTWLITLRNRAGVLQDRFVIVGEEEDETTTRLTCESLISVMSRDRVQEFRFPSAEDVAETGDDTGTLRACLQALIAQQSNIQLGNLTGGMQFKQLSIEAEYTSAMALLREIQEDVGGYFWVDGDWHLHWAASPPAIDRHRVINTDKQLADISRKLNKRSGAIEENWELTALDLSQLDDRRIWAEEAFDLGEVITVNTLRKSGDLPHERRIGGITIDLAQPERVSLDLVEVGTYRGKAPRLFGVLSDFADRLERLERMVGNRIPLMDAQLGYTNPAGRFSPVTMDPATGESGCGSQAGTKKGFDVTGYASVGIKPSNGDVTPEGSASGDSGYEVVRYDEDSETILPATVVGNNIQPIATVGGAGDSNKVAPEKHTHEGMPWVKVTTSSALPASAADGQIAYVEDVNAFYRRVDGSWERDQFVNFVYSTTLPAIPTRGVTICYFTSMGGGDGDNQLWIASAYSTKWTPLEKATDVSLGEVS